MLGLAQAPIFLAERQVIIKIESPTVKSARLYESVETFEGFFQLGCWKLRGGQLLGDTEEPLDGGEDSGRLNLT